jgi:hypothetical protein
MERCVMEVVGEVPPWAREGYGHGEGYGHCSVFGFGEGYGDGYGYGYGPSYGNGCGAGEGTGEGYGFCTNYGEGEGYGNYGYGSGDGHGTGGYADGYGLGGAAYWHATIPHFAAKWPQPQQTRLADLSARGATIAFWRSNADGCPCNGGWAEPAYPSLIQTAPGPLQLCQEGTLHATLDPDQWQGERWWIVALIGEVVHDESKMGALTREIIGEAL